MEVHVIYNSHPGVLFQIDLLLIPNWHISHWTRFFLAKKAERRARGDAEVPRNAQDGTPASLSPADWSPAAVAESLTKLLEIQMVKKCWSNEDVLTEEIVSAAISGLIRNVAERKECRRSQRTRTRYTRFSISYLTAIKCIHFGGFISAVARGLVAVSAAQGLLVVRTYNYSRPRSFRSNGVRSAAETRYLSSGCRLRTPELRVESMLVARQLPDRNLLIVHGMLLLNTTFQSGRNNF